MINQAKDWEDFLKRMEALEYEIKYGKHIAFRHKDKERFTRAKTIGEDYTEEKLKIRIENALLNKNNSIKKRVGNVIDISKNEKAKNSKGYEIWARKHNIKAMSESILDLREQCINSIKELDELIKKSADDRQNLLDKIQKIEKEMDRLSSAMEHVNTINKYKNIYKYYKNNRQDKSFESEYHAEIFLYKVAIKKINEDYTKLPNTKEILSELYKLQEKRIPSCRSILKIKNIFLI